MRRIAKVMLAGALAVALAIQAGPAGAVRLREYRGRTSAGKGMYLQISGRGSDLRLHMYAFRVNMDCEDGSIQRWAFFAGFAGRGLALRADRSFEHGFEGEAFAMAVTGTVGPHDAEGTIAASSAFPDEPTCSTGDLTWSAHERDIVGRLPAANLDRVAHVLITAEEGTTVRIRAA
jgi:hypothetical protein